MKLDELDVVTKNTLAVQYRQEGMAVIAGVDLPDTFTPPFSDLVFLQVGANCEVYIAGSVQYQGAANAWQQAVRRRPSPGNTRKVLETRGDLFTGISKFKSLLQDAGGEYRVAATAVPVHAPAAEPQGAATAPATAPQPLPPAVPVQDPSPRPDDVDTPLPQDPSPQGGTPAPAAPSSGHGRVPGLRNLVEDCRRTPRYFAGREDVLRALKTNLIRESKPGVVLVGKEGVGKSAVVEMLATEIAFNRNIPAPLTNTPVFELPLGSLVENGRYVGDIERQARRYLDVPGRPIFFADEIHQLARPELRALCDVLKPALAGGRIRLIGATTPVEWRKVEDTAFKRRFLEMTLDEPSPWEAFIMLRERVRTLARHHELEIDEQTIREAIMLSARYLPMRQFPDKAIDVLDLAAALQTTHPAEDERAPVTEAAGNVTNATGE
jgi:MoxR-like ATPase